MRRRDSRIIHEHQDGGGVEIHRPRFCSGRRAQRFDPKFSRFKLITRGDAPALTVRRLAVGPRGDLCRFDQNSLCRPSARPLRVIFEAEWLASGRQFMSLAFAVRLRPTPQCGSAATSTIARTSGWTCRANTTSVWSNGRRARRLPKRVRMGPLHVAVPLAPPEGLSWSTLDANSPSMSGFGVH